MRAWKTVSVPVVAMALVLAMSGCGRTAGPDDGSAGDGAAGGPLPAAGAAAGGDERELAVYAAVVRHHLTGWNAGDPLPPVVYVVERAVPDAADGMRGFDDAGGAAIEPWVRERLAAELADVAPIRFVPTASAVVTADTGCPTVDGGGAVLTLAPVAESGDRLTIGLGDFRACLDGHWLTYVVTHTAAGWTVDGTTGPVAVA